MSGARLLDARQKTEGTHFSRAYDACATRWAAAAAASTRARRLASSWAPTAATVRVACSARGCGCGSASRIAGIPVVHAGATSWRISVRRWSSASLSRIALSIAADDERRRRAASAADARASAWAAMCVKSDTALSISSCVCKRVRARAPRGTKTLDVPTLAPL